MSTKTTTGHYAPTTTQVGRRVPGECARGGKPCVIVVPKDVAGAFVRLHHSTQPYVNPRGLLYTLGVVAGGQLVAVMTTNTPTARAILQSMVMEYCRKGWGGSQTNMQAERISSTPTAACTPRTNDCGKTLANLSSNPETPNRVNSKPMHNAAAPMVSGGKPLAMATAANAFSGWTPTGRR